MVRFNWCPSIRQQDPTVDSSKWDEEEDRDFGSANGHTTQRTKDKDIDLEDGAGGGGGFENISHHQHMLFSGGISSKSLPSSSSQQQPRATPFNASASEQTVVARNNNNISSSTSSRFSSSASTYETSASSSSSKASIVKKFPALKNRKLILLTILSFGVVFSTCFLSLGILGAVKDQDMKFEQNARDVVNYIQTNLLMYTMGAKSIQENCRPNGSTAENHGHHSVCSRQNFFELYQYLESEGLDYFGAAFLMNVSHHARSMIEMESRGFYAQHFPHVQYNGIVGFETDAESQRPINISDTDFSYTADQMSHAKPETDIDILKPSGHRPFYFPTHMVAPVEKNEGWIEFDFYSSPIRRKTIDEAIHAMEPAMTPPLKCSRNIEDGYNNVILMHPGVELKVDPFDTSSTEKIPIGPGNHTLAAVVISIPRLLKKAFQGTGTHLNVFLFDVTESSNEYDGIYLGAAACTNTHGDNKHSRHDHYHSHGHYPGNVIDSNQEGKFKIITRTMSVQDVYNEQRNTRIFNTTFPVVGNRRWRVIVSAHEHYYRPKLTYIVCGGAVMFIACVCAGIWFNSSLKRHDKMNLIKAKAESDRAKLIIQNTAQVARAERNLNEFLAHEVRNPLAAAMSASTFVTAEVNELQPLTTEESKTIVREDMAVINSSLSFINDLLRNMLDMHRAASKQMIIEKSPTDIRMDILEPVATMLSRRGDNFHVVVECDTTANDTNGNGKNDASTGTNNNSIVIMADRLRLKQVILNLSGNARKFVQKGFIKLRVRIINDGDSIELSVEDSGPGIPKEKQEGLFCKFQESLDSLSQGTGLGLSLCKHLIGLMDGEIRLDPTYHSGIENCPGTRFVITLHEKCLFNEIDIEEAMIKQEQQGQQQQQQQGDKKEKGKTSTTKKKKKQQQKRKSFKELLSINSISSFAEEDDDDDDNDIDMFDLLDSTTESVPSATNSITTSTTTTTIDMNDMNMSTSKKNSIIRHIDDAQQDDKNDNNTAMSLSGTNILSSSASASSSASPISSSSADSSSVDSSSSSAAGATETTPPPTTLPPSPPAKTSSMELPKDFRVLFVDDDFILRKLFIRTIKRVAPDWKVYEAANGETALRLVEEYNNSSTTNDNYDGNNKEEGQQDEQGNENKNSNKTTTTKQELNYFDLIFMDQYMASVEKQLLGTETVRAMRSKNVTSIICGLSANDMEHLFYESGANAFMMKPFPCNPQKLKEEIYHIIFESSTSTT